MLLVAEEEKAVMALAVAAMGESRQQTAWQDERHLLPPDASQRDRTAGGA